MRESVAIADACFDRLLEIARIGITEREIGAAMYERCTCSAARTRCS